LKREKRTYSIREVLDSWLAKNRSIGYRIKASESLTLWKRIPDEYVTSHSYAAGIKEGVLMVNTDSSVLANELSLREKEFRDLLNNELGEPIVKRIVFKSGFVQTNKDKPPPHGKKGKKLSIETLNRVNEVVESVKQQEIREGLRRLFISSAEKGRSKE
jgi:predicted nucleic acid-binding Zn ribbon protein